MADTPLQAALRAAFGSKVSLRAPGSITDGMLAGNSVNTENLKDSNVTEGKIGAGAVTNGKLGASAVTFDKLNAAAIATDDEALAGTADNKIMTPKATAASLARYLPLTGGTVTGATTVNETLTANALSVRASAGISDNLFVEKLASVNELSVNTKASVGGQNIVRSVNGIYANEQGELPLPFIPKTGDAGTVSAYTTVGSNTTVNDASPDACETSSSVTVSNGTTGKCWTKVVRLTGASPTVSLGRLWKWQGGSAPTLSQNGFLVLCWCGAGGIAVFNATAS